ncbi:hypothetical protein EVAR_70541_1 [Eumeta japonica]|uniref:RNase H type-1 domain-containing protein n=1 Tax=Eumeta variegata TaxID=151549 RepID=A0A4C1SGU6_EUMVA|nr:hypothetical protein EVAR_70541_1 [Eumeta japonica]
MDGGVGSGVFSHELGILDSHRLPDSCSFFQAEVFAACRTMHGRDSLGSIGIFVDSQAAILALNSYTTTSSLFEECKQELSRLSCLFVITLVWFSAHRDYYGNERADQLARRVTALDISSVESVGKPLGSIKSGILRHFLRKSEEKWRRLDTCRMARFLWPSYNEKRIMQLAALSRTDISRLLAVMTLDTG